MDTAMHPDPGDQPTMSTPLSLKIPGSLIRRLRREREWSARHLGKMVGASQQTINKLEKGLTKDSKYFAALSKLFGVTPEMLEGDPSTVEVRTLDKPKIAKLEYERRPTLPLYPNLGRVSVGVYLLFKCPSCKILRPSVLRHAKDAYAWIMPDGSMSPEYEAGDTLIADPGEAPRVGRSHIFRHRHDKNCDNARVLRLVKIKDQHYFVRSHCGDNDGDGGSDRLPIDMWKAHLVKAHHVDHER
jgi:transcriptional regulator with XRE-family HTH domain